MRFVNPILFGDYSDPDVIRVGRHFYMVSSSFTYLPGIPVLRSQDLVTWELIGYAAASLPYARYDVPVHKCGTWAPSIRWHDGLFRVYVCLPDEGLLTFTAADPAGRWDCHIVKEVTGWIDPCPFWDDDGSAWLVHGFANSRAGIKNLLYLHRMSEDGLTILDTGRPIFFGDDTGDETAEGPKMYKRNGQYWILCPAGGVPTGYQLALRADRPEGPYTRQVVLSQGSTAVNGPHQGGWVTAPDGSDWFIHFQDVGVYGRIPHLQPVSWESGWPVMGKDGEPVAEGETHFGSPVDPASLSMSDTLCGPLKLHWQWQANPRTAWYRCGDDGLRLYAYPAPSLFEAGQFLSQLMQHRQFDMDITIRADLRDGDRAGIGMMGYRYSYLAIEPGCLSLWSGEATETTLRAPVRVHETLLCRLPYHQNEARVQMAVRDGMCSYAVCTDAGWTAVGGPQPMACGGWTSARPGFFCMNTSGIIGGSALFDSLEVTPR